MSQRFSVYTAFSRLRLSAFSRDAEGSVAVLFALIVLPVMLFVGAALDLSRTGPATVNLQTALDSAVLAGVKRPGEQVAVAQRQFAAATGDKPYQSVSATFTLNPDNTLTGVANATIKTAIMSLARVNSFSLAARSKAKPPQTPSVVAFQLPDRPPQHRQAALQLPAHLAARTKQRNTQFRRPHADWRAPYCWSIHCR